MPVRKLSDSFVRGHRLAGDTAECFTDVTGRLEVRISPTSRKWRYQYRFAGRGPRRITFGDVTVMSYAEARERAAFYDRAITDGRDPEHLSYNPKGAVSVADVLDHHLSTLTHPPTHAHVSRLYRWVREDHGATLVRDFTAGVLRDWMLRSYTHRVGAADVLLRNLTAAYNKAAHELSGLKMPDGHKNPAKGLRAHLPFFHGRERGGYAVAWEDDVWRRVLKGLETAYADPTIWAPGIMVLELLARTGARPGEITTLLDGEIVEEMKGGLLRTKIVKQHHKSQWRTGKPRVIWLGDDAVSVIERAREHRAETGAKGEFLFPQRRTQTNQRRPHVHQLTHYTARLAEITGVHFTPYNLRSAYINHTLDEIGLDRLGEVAAGVGHTDIATTKEHYISYRNTRLADAAVRSDLALRRKAIVDQLNTENTGGLVHNTLHESKSETTRIGLDQRVPTGTLVLRDADLQLEIGGLAAAGEVRAAGPVLQARPGPLGQTLLRVRPPAAHPVRVRP